MPRGIQPRVAPTMTYGVVGSTVYNDVIDGATQLVGLVNQGRRDVQQADMQAEQQNLQRQKFAHQKAQDEFSNSMDLIAAGIDPASMGMGGGLPDNALKQAQQQSRQARTVDSLQALLNDSAATSPGGTGFDPVAMDNFVAQLGPQLNTNNREDFALEHVTTEQGTRFILDEASYKGLQGSNPEMAQWFTAAGAAPDTDDGSSRIITREDVGRHLGQEISKMPTGTPQQARAQAAAWETYRNSPATSGTARVYETEKARTTLAKTARMADKDAQATTRNLVTNDEVLTDSEKTTIISSADERSQRIINTAMAAAEKAENPQAVAKIERKMRADLNAVASDTTKRAMRAKEDTKFATSLVGWSGSNTFNINAAKWGGKGTVKQMTENAQTASGKISQRVAAHGRDAYLKEFGDSEANERAFNNKIAAIEADALKHMQDGSRVNSDNYEFVRKYAPLVLEHLQDNGVPQFRAPEKAESAQVQPDATPGVGDIFN